jgi:hypothetical protein
MAGGLMQLIAYGAQDVYLTGSAQITFFKVVYRRHTNFAVEPIPQTFNGASDFGRTVTCTLNRNGDLMTKMYVNINLAAATNGDNFGYVKRLGLAIVQHYKIEIGGTKIDEQYGDWLNIWYEFTHKTGQERGYAKMIGDVPELTTISTVNKPKYQLYVPLQFWFCRNDGLALPLIALQYHDVRITIDFRPAAQCVNYLTTNGVPKISMNDAQLIIDYVYLDSEERKRFAQASHEYLFEQLQFTGSESITGINNKYRLNFNHPSKYLVWASHLEKYASANQYISYADDGDWEKARDRFAKIVWLATRSGLSSDGTNISTSGTVQDEVWTPTTATWASGIDSFVSGQLLYSDSISGTVSTTTSPEHVIITKNNFTISHMSLQAGSLFTGILGTGTSVPSSASALLAINAYTLTNHFNYSNNIDGTDNPIVSAKLQLNGGDRMQERDGHYFNYVQPWQHFTNTPADGINVYSFALKPEEHQPSGTCNFSRIDNATLQTSFGTGNSLGDNTYYSNTIGGTNSNSLLNIYTVNYNVLRVMSGMAGAAYSN